MISPAKRTLICLTAVLAASCLIQKPSTELPAPPTITAFSANSGQVARGGEVTLSWAVTGASTLTLLALETGPVDLDGRGLTGSITLTLAHSTRFVLTAQGEGGTDTRALSVAVAPDAAQPLLTVTPPVVEGGQSATLTWQAPGATTLTLTANGVALPTLGQLSAGALTVTPQTDTVYALTSSLGNAQVQVTVLPRVLTAQASPSASQPGGEVTLSWTTAGASQVVVVAEGRGELYRADVTPAVTPGSFTDSLPPDAGAQTYTVEAHAGDVSHGRSVQVAVGPAPLITRFDVPGVVAVGGLCQLIWETTGADAVELHVDGATIFRTTDVARAQAGFYSFPVGDADFGIELVAFSPLGVKATRLATVDTVRPPTAATLEVTPSSAVLGAPVTVTWSAPEARRVRLTDSFGDTVFSRMGAQAEGGQATLYPQGSTTYTLTADNLLGDSVSTTAAVTVTGTPPALTRMPATPVTGQWLQLGAPPGAVLYGFPHAQVVNTPEASFIDISQTGTLVLPQGANITSVPTTFSTRLWGRRLGGDLTVSRAGWVAFNAQATDPLLSRVALPNNTSANALPNIIAPFWASLSLTSAGAGVYMQVVGEAPDETLIVQWEKARLGTNDQTFQLRLTQRGALSFHYQTITSPGTLYTIGTQDFTRTLAATWTTPPASNQALYFFSPVTPPIEVKVLKGARYGGYVQLGDVFHTVDVPSGAITPSQELAVSEVMFRPAPSVGSTGQYVELLNHTGAPLDLTGWRLESGGTTFELPPGLIAQPAVPLVLAGSDDTGLNDGVPADVSWEGSGFTLPEDGGTLFTGTADGGASLTLTRPPDGGFGMATEFAEVRVNSMSTTSCLADAGYGNQGQQGSPGVLRGCGDWLKYGIAGNFLTAPVGSALALTPTGTLPALDEGSATVTLPQPFTFWGQEFTQAHVSSNGFITFSTPLATNAYPGNVVAATTGAPLAMVAPFWDDLSGEDSSTGTARVAAFSAGDRYVVSWEHVGMKSLASDINVQLHLVDDGTVEFHYGAMTVENATAVNVGRAAGSSATAWLKHPAGGVAAPASLNQQLITPFQGFRFVPQ